jgi:hypothetical protein
LFLHLLALRQSRLHGALLAYSGPRWASFSDACPFDGL